MTKNRDQQDKNQSNAYPPESNDSEARRRVIEKLIGGAGAIGTVYWTSPVVHSVVLPAHAQTSPAPPSPPSPPAPTPGPPAPPGPPSPPF
jgi:hypothetical protein